MNNIKRLRLQHNYTQQQVAEYLGTNQPNYSAKERDIWLIPKWWITQLATLYHVPEDVITADRMDISVAIEKYCKTKGLHLIQTITEWEQYRAKML